MTVAFTGHRPCKLPWGEDETDGRCAALKLAVAEEIERLIEEGADTFYTGGAEGIDTYCAELVLKKREKYPVRLFVAVPFAGQEERWSASSRERYRSILKRADQAETLAEGYSPGCMMKRNRYLVDHCDVLVAVYGGGAGGTRNTVNYAEKRGKRVIVIPLGVDG